MNFTHSELEALREVCDELAPYVPYGAAPLWTLKVAALESDFDHLARNASGAFGLFQRITTPRPYNVTSIRQQILDYGDFTMAQIHTFGIEDIPTLGHFYCLNLAPARVNLGVLYAGLGPYSMPPGWDAARWGATMELIKKHPEVVAPKAYLANQLFDVPWRDAAGRKVRKGFIALEDLEPKVEAAAKRNEKRIQEELKALEEVI